MKPEWVEAGARRLGEAFVTGDWSGFTEGDRRYLATVVVEEVEPLILADERERFDAMALTVDAMQRAQRDLRTQIAADIHATGHATSCVTRYNGPLAPDIYGCDCGLDRHVAIAEGRSR